MRDIKRQTYEKLVISHVHITKILDTGEKKFLRPYKGPKSFYSSKDNSGFSYVRPVAWQIVVYSLFVIIFCHTYVKTIIR